MRLAEEPLVTFSQEPGHELVFSLLVTREHLTALLDARLFKPAGLTAQQFNVLRILKGGAPEGQTIGDIKRRVIYRNADVPRLVDRMVRMGLVKRIQHPTDRRSCRVQLTPKGEATQDALAPDHAALMQEVAKLLPPPALKATLDTLEHLRVGLQCEPEVLQES